jgi:cysteinyl-tRNA synthetase
MEIGDTELRQSAAAVGRLDAFARRARAAGVVPAGPPALDAFVAAMDDDFDTPKAIAVVFETVRRGNAALDAGRLEEASSALTTVSELVGVLGLVLDDGATTDGRAEEEIDRLVAARDEARVARRFDEADRIRDELAARGVTLEDTPHGTLWRR